MKRLALPTLLLAAGALLASGCVYRMNIQQGNYLVAESVSQLKEGMTRSQVRFLLGTPMVPDAFNEDRWDYYYFFSSQQFKEPLKRRLTVYFADDKVQRFENLGVPTAGRPRAARARSAQAPIAETKGKQRKPGFWQPHVRPRQTRRIPVPRSLLRLRSRSRERRIPCRLPQPRARARRDSFGSDLSGR